MRLLGNKQYQDINEPLAKLLDERKVLITAHRGLSGGIIIENTVEGALLSFRSEADMVEFDVAQSLDGTYWIFHDGYEPARFGTQTRLTELHDADIEKLEYLIHPVNNRPRKVDTLAGFLGGLQDRFLTCDRSWRYWPTGLLDFLDEHCKPEYVMLKSDPDEQSLDCLKAHAVKYPYMPIVRSEEEIRRVLAIEEINTVAVEVLASKSDERLADPDLFRELIEEHNLLVLVNCETLEDGRDLFCGWDDYTSVVDGPEAGWDKSLATGANMIHTDFPWLVRQRIDRLVK